MPFLPGTAGVGRYLRHGTLPLLLASLWLEPPARDAWLALHARGAQLAGAGGRLRTGDDLPAWLERVENEAWLVPESVRVAGELAASAFLADPNRAQLFADLFSGMRIVVSALITAWGVDWRRWVFQAVNVGYRTPEFGQAELSAWLKISA